MIRHSIGLCNTCKEESPASIYLENERVVIETLCPEHGLTKGEAESDPEVFAALEHIEERARPDYFHILTLPVTYRCNLNCKFCYIPHKKKDIPVEELKKQIEGFRGENIALSGGEPTLREELPELIRSVREAGKGAVLNTNGIKLADKSYLKSLVGAGLQWVFFSLDSFSPEFYKSLKNAEDLAGQKMQALENLKQEGVKTVISSTIYKGGNDNEIRELFDYCARNKDFVIELRLRTSQSIGRYDESYEPFHVSELISMFASQLGLTKRLLLDNFAK